VQASCLLLTSFFGDVYYAETGFIKQKSSFFPTDNAINPVSITSLKDEQNTALTIACPQYSSFLCYAVHLDPPKSPDRRGTFFVPPLGRGARGDLTYLIIWKSAVKSFIKICRGSARVPTPEQSGQPLLDCPYHFIPKLCN
jgi:hypothetical protein